MSASVSAASPARKYGNHCRFGWVISKEKIRPFENQIVATPSDWCDSTIPSQEKNIATGKTHASRITAAGVQEALSVKPSHISLSRLTIAVRGAGGTDGVSATKTPRLIALSWLVEAVTKIALCSTQLLETFSSRVVQMRVYP